MAAALTLIHIEQIADLADFHQRLRNKALAAEAGVHRHQQHHIQPVEHVFQHINRRGRIEHQACLAAQIFNQTQAAVDMAAGFGVESDDVGTGLGKRLNQIIHRLHHQMHIHRHRGIRLERRTHHRAESEVGHIMIIHHIKMNQVGARFHHPAHFLAQAGKIGR